MKRIVTLTLNPAIDLAADAEQVKPIRKIRCEKLKMDPGGGGINVARVIGELGGCATAVYTEGGSLGKLLLDLLDRERIDAVPVEIANPTRESFTVNETSSGRQFRFVLPGPELQEAEWRRCLKVLEALEPFPDFLVASGSLPPGVPDDIYARMARMVGARGGRLLLDTSGEALGAALEERVYLIKPNLRELRELTGRGIESEQEQEEACRELVLRRNAEMVALTLGDKGALLVTRDRTRRAAIPKVEVVSPVGAGDSFMGAMALALAREKSAEEAFVYGVAAGTAAVMTPGTELCRKDDVERLFRRLAGQGSGSTWI
jgi:6-phosphofructokinase 2